MNQIITIPGWIVIIIGGYHLFRLMAGITDFFSRAKHAQEIKEGLMKTFEEKKEEGPCMCLTKIVQIELLEQAREQAAKTQEEVEVHFMLPQFLGSVQNEVIYKFDPKGAKLQ